MYFLMELNLNTIDVFDYSFALSFAHRFIPTAEQKFEIKTMTFYKLILLFEALKIAEKYY